MAALFCKAVNLILHLNCYRWSFLIALLLIGVATASEEEDDVPDAGVEGDDDELALDREVILTDCRLII